MAHTDACKIQVTQFVKKCTDGGMSINSACKEAERESDGIPSKPVRAWWYEIQKEVKSSAVVENSTTEGVENPTIPTKRKAAGRPKRTPSQLTAWKKASKSLKKIMEYMSENSIL